MVFSPGIFLLILKYNLRGLSMKKNLLYLAFLIIFISAGLKTVAQPTIAYNATNNYTVGTAIPTLAPTSTGVGTYGYGTGNLFTGATPNNPYGMAFDASGNVYVANQGAGNVTEYTSGGAYITTFIATATTPVLTNATTIGFDNTGLAYATRKPGNLFKYTTGGAYTSTLANPASSLSMAIDASNDIFLADYNSGAVREYSTAGVPGLVITVGKPTGVAVDSNGNIYILDFLNKDVLKYNAAGTLISTLITGLSAAAYGLNVDKSGNVYVGDSGNTSVKVYPPTGGTTPIATISGISDPRGVLADTKGNLYVSNWAANTVTKYPPAGGFYLTSGTLPPGLSFDSKTGNITGTPTSNSSGNYTVTAYNSAGQATTSASFTINCATPPTVAYSGSPFAYTIGTPITSLTPATTNSPTSFVISPNLATNTGLSFDNTTGVISGTPTTGTIAINYTITASNTAGAGPPTTISIQVYPQSPTVAYTGSPFTYGVGTAITTLTPATTNSPTLFAISPNLNTNTGLSFNTSTGIISGTPTIASPAVTYTITATNANPTAGTTTISIAVVAPPTIAYTGSPYNYTVGTLITSLTPTTTNSPTSYTISPNLTTNTGLSFSNTSGVISGTPTTPSLPVTYTVTAINAGGSGTTTISVQVYPKAPTVAYTGSPFTYGVGTAITALTPATTNSPTTFAISPNLTTNTGLTFNTSTGVISGTPTVPSAAVTYTITASNANPTVGTTTISIAVISAPTIAYTGSPFSYTVGTAITSLTPATTNSPTSFSISPNLTTNTGLTFSTSTGVISGTPTKASAPVTYTVTATNIAGPGTTTISIQVYSISPTVAYTGSPFTYGVGLTVTTLTPATTNSPTNFTISPNLTTNTGLTFNTTTGVISGTPTTASPATTYTVSAYNNNPVPGTTTISIVVYSVPMLTYPTQAFTAGTAISPISPSNSGGPVGSGTNYGAGIVLTGGTVNNPQNLGIDPTTGDVYVANAGPAGSINIWDSNGGFIRNVALAGFSPVGIAFDPSGNAYIADATSNRVFKLTAAPGNLNVASRKAITPVGAISQLTGIAVDPSGNVYVTDYPGEAYKYIGSGTTYSLSLTYNNTSLQNTSDVALDNAGNVYVSNASAAAGYKRVVRYNSIGAFVALITNLNLASSVYVDGGGNIYVSNTGTNTINIYDASANPITTIAVNGPSGVIVDGKGNVFVSTSGNQVIEFPPITGYSISSPLPPGLTFDNNTGIISGTPTTGFPSTTYTVTAYNFVGKGGGTVTISCNLNAPVIAYNPNLYTLTVGTAISPIPPTSSGGPIPGTPGYGAGTAILAAANGLNNPWGVATDPLGNVYTVNYTSNSVTKFSGGAASTFIASLPTPNPIGIDFDSFGNAYVLTTTGLYKYNSAGVYQSAVVFTGIANATGITIDDAGGIYVAEGTAGNTPALDMVIKFPTTGGAGNVLFTGGGGYYITGGVAVDSNGFIYVVDNYGSTPSIDKYDQNGVVQPGGPYTYAGSAYGIYIDAGDNLYIAGSNQVQVFNQAKTRIAVLPGLTDPRGVVTDVSGNLYVSDYTNNTVTKYAPVSGYYINGPLPPGLAFNDATGVFTGKPTDLFAPVTLTVTAYNGSGTGSTNITFNCGNANFWHGVTAGNTDWNTPSNWSAGTVPLSTDVAYIGSVSGATAAFTYLPTISAGETVTVAGVVLGSANSSNIAAGIVVNGTGVLNVTTNITYQGDKYSNRAYTATISGSGSINTASVIMAANYNLHLPYTIQLSSSIAKLNISGPLSLIAGVTNKGTKFFNPIFNVTGGITAVGGTLQTTNSAGAASVSTVTVQNGTLQLAASAALSSLSAAGTNVITFNNPGAIIEYSGAAQTVYTDAAITGLATGPSYNSIKFSGTGIKTPNGTAASNLNIAGDFTNTLANTASSNVVLTSTIVNFNGVNNQSLAGGAGPTYSATSTIAPPSPTGTVFNTVNFSNGSSSTTKTMTSGGFAVASTGVLTMVGASSYTVLNANGNLTLNSSATSSATVAKITAGGPTITGNVNVQRWITGNNNSTYRGYRLMSSPVNGTTDSYPNNYSVNYLLKSCYIRGTSGIGFDGVGNDNILLYRENVPPSNATFTSGTYNGINAMAPMPNYSYPIDGNTSSPTFMIPVGDGFLFFFRGDRLVNTYAAETVSTYVPTSAIVTATGKLNQGSYPVKDWYNSGTTYLGFTNTTANSAVRGFNLVGNPYASTIDLTTASTTAGAGLQISSGIAGKGVESNFYELNPTTQNFDVWSNSLNSGTNQATKYIASGQGFFVKVDTVNQTLTFNEAAKVNNQNTGTNLYMIAPARYPRFDWRYYAEHPFTKN